MCETGTSGIWPGTTSTSRSRARPRIQPRKVKSKKEKVKKKKRKEGKSSKNSGKQNKLAFAKFYMSTVGPPANLWAPRVWMPHFLYFRTVPLIDSKGIFCR